MRSDLVGVEDPLLVGVVEPLGVRGGVKLLFVAAATGCKIDCKKKLQGNISIIHCTVAFNA